MGPAPLCTAIPTIPEHAEGRVLSLPKGCPTHPGLSREDRRSKQRPYVADGGLPDTNYSHDFPKSLKIGWTYEGPPDRNA